MDMQQVLPSGIITRRRRDTLDLVFMILLLRNSLVKYRFSLLTDCHSDHKPIRTVINFSITETRLNP